MKLTTCSFIAALAAGSAAVAVGPLIGPQVRVDVTGNWAFANETTASAGELYPNRIVAAWNDQREFPNWRCGVGLSFDGGQTWVDGLLRPPAGYEADSEGDPMTAVDDRTGTLWVGAISFSTSGGVYVARME